MVPGDVGTSIATSHGGMGQGKPSVTEESPARGPGEESPLAGATTPAGNEENPMMALVPSASWKLKLGGIIL